MDNITTRFEEKLYDMAYSDIPDSVMKKSIACLIDYLAVVIGGSLEYKSIQNSFISTINGIGACHVLGTENTTDLRTAIMINAFNAHVLELDDSHRVAMTHVGASLFSTLVGVAEMFDKTIIDVLQAAVVGYETAIRLANAVQPSHKKRGFHVSGTCCTVGCAIGVAALLRYSRTQIHNTFSAAVTSAAGLLAVISGNSQQKPYNIANAAISGTTAALYGSRFVGAVDILGDSRGFLHAVTEEPHIERLFEGGYAIEGIYQKLYASCRHCHAPIEATLAIRKHLGNVNPDDVSKILVRTYDLAIEGHDHTEILGVSSAKQSIPYGVAAAFIYQDCSEEVYKTDKIYNQQVLKIAQKTIVVEDKSLTNLVPQKRAAYVDITYQGKIFSARVDYPKGEPENPITINELKAKFLSLTGNIGFTDKKFECLTSKFGDSKNNSMRSVCQFLSN